MKQYTESERQEMDAQAKAERAAFFAKYPECPISDEIECLNLIMKREFAEAILRGEKTVEYRSYSQHYCNRLFDKKVQAYEPNIADEDIADFEDFAAPLRVVKKIHFHNYENSWWLDVEVVYNYICAPCKDDVDAIESEYGDSELREMQEEFDKKKTRTERPLFFFFALGEVLGTNLTKE